MRRIKAKSIVTVIKKGKVGRIIIKGRVRTKIGSPIPRSPYGRDVFVVYGD